MREKISFDKEWYFHRGEITYKEPLTKGFMYVSAKTERAHIGPASKDYRLYTDCFENNIEHKGELWKQVDLPHDYVIEGVPDARYNCALGFLHYDNAWYVKKFKLGKEDQKKRITLLFEGIASAAVIWLNGCLMKRHFGGYTSFEVDITDVVKFGEENTLSVYVSTQEHEGWWYEGGGIYRHVFLIKTALLSVDLWGVYAKPIYLGDEKWRVDTVVTLRNDEVREKEFEIKGTIIDAAGKVASHSKIKGKIGGKEITEFNYNFTVISPERWSPDYPNQYVMRTEILSNGVVLDEYTTKFGFRTFRVDPEQGLFINDRHYKIKGLCGHADCGLLGKAVPDNIHRYKVQLMKEMGANGYRTTHYMQAEALMDALDENGFIVMDEVRWFESTEDGKKQLTTLIKRDRNRPGVFFWSIGNEEPHHTTEEGRRIFQSLMVLAKKLDDSRLVMAAVVDSPEKATVYKEMDVIGVNYNWDKYEGIHKKYPRKGIFASECCATGTTRGWYHSDDENLGYLSAYDKDASDLWRGREFTWKFLAEHDWILGGYQWIAFEHRGEAVWPRICSQSGAIDLFMQKKDAFWQNQSHWTDYRQMPMVHLLPHWNFAGLEGKPIRVVAYTNAPQVALFVNGKSFGLQRIERYGHGEWSVPYAPGYIEVRAYNEEGDQIASDRKVTSGRAEKLMLTLDTKDVTANGEDVALLTCYAVDGAGNEVPDASPIVQFTAEGSGKILSTGSDISEHSTVYSNIRKMRAGRIGIAVKMGTQPGEVCIIAASDGLSSAVLNWKIH